MNFSIFFLARVFYRFSGFAKEVTSRSRVKTGAIPKDHLCSVLPFLLEEWMTSLVCLASVIWVVTAAKQSVKSSR